MAKREQYYLVSGSILPETMRKVVQARELLADGEVKTVNQAVEKVGISRSTFYKYKNGILPFSKGTEDRILTLALVLIHQPGILSKVVNAIAAKGGNITTITQNIPVRGTASLSISFETTGLKSNGEELIHSLNSIEGVKQVEIVS
ncbi:MAG TPA: ACT domain-containing protein [Clostridia bacterium]|nr:ACT domain-containing protein [Clostridia bacterium]